MGITCDPDNKDITCAQKVKIFLFCFLRFLTRGRRGKKNTYRFILRISLRSYNFSTSGTQHGILLNYHNLVAWVLLKKPSLGSRYPRPMKIRYLEGAILGLHEFSIFFLIGALLTDATKWEDIWHHEKKLF